MRKELKKLIEDQKKDFYTKTERHFIIPKQPKNALACVTLLEKMILWLKIGDFTYKEIAQILKITEVRARGVVYRIKHKCGIKANLFRNALKSK